MNQKLQFQKHPTGFTLVEVLAAVGVFVLGASASLTVLSNAIASTRDSVEIEEIVTLAIEEVEQQRSRLLPTTVTETIGNYTRTTAIDGCTFTGTTMSCTSTCDDTVPVCEIVVTVTNNVTNETQTLTTVKLTEQL